MAMTFTKKQILGIVGGVVVLAAAGWLAWQYFEDSAPPPKSPAAKSGARPAAAKQAKAPPPAAPSPAPAVSGQAPAAPSPAPAVSGQAPAPVPAAATPPTAAAAPEPTGSTQMREEVTAERQARRPPAPIRSRAGEDARSCLAMATDAEVRKCAEQYR